MRYDFHSFHRPMAGKLAIPELSDGFDPSLAAPADGFLPVSYITEEVPAGTYAIHLVLEALSDLSELFLFTGRKLLRDIISLKKGELYEQTFYQTVAEIIPRYYAEVCPIQHLFITCCAGTGCRDTAAFRLVKGYAEPVSQIPVIYLCGDSTVTDQSSEIPYHPGACYASWGQALPFFLNGRAAVENQAHCGLTTETFRSEGHMDIVKAFIRPGDYCLIQFGHNDQKVPHLLADREYPGNLIRYIGEIRVADATPVLVTSPGRNIWKPDGAYRELLAEHVQAVKDVGEKEGVPVIDLHTFTVNQLMADGQEAARGYFHPGDYTHTNEYGAYLCASYIAKELHRLFGTVIPCRKNPPVFRPPLHLWDSLLPTDNRTGGTGQKEQFDAMEKSTSALLEAIEQAKKAGQT